MPKVERVGDEPDEDRNRVGQRRVHRAGLPGLGQKQGGSGDGQHRLPARKALVLHEKDRPDHQTQPDPRQPRRQGDGPCLHQDRQENSGQ
jgi:hypothetical protein